MVADTRAASGARRPRPLNQPRLVSIELDDSGAPIALLLGQRCAVETVIETWRLADEWWHPQPVCRAYWRLLLEDGRTIDVFRDLTRDRWYRQAYSG